jgi:hypothetical protein
MTRPIGFVVLGLITLLLATACGGAIKAGAKAAKVGADEALGVVDDAGRAADNGAGAADDAAGAGMAGGEAGVKDAREAADAALSARPIALLIADGYALRQLNTVRNANQFASRPKAAISALTGVTSAVPAVGGRVAVKAQPDATAFAVELASGQRLWIYQARTQGAYSRVVQRIDDQIDGEDRNFICPEGRLIAVVTSAESRSQDDDAAEIVRSQLEEQVTAC